MHPGGAEGLIYIYIYEVHTISFQTFVIWAYKIGVDSRKFRMLLLYILWDDWPIFMISGSNEQLQQQLEYCCILSSDPAKLSNEKCTSVNNRCIRSKRSGDDLDCRGVKLGANCDARRKYVDVKLLYNPGDRKFRSVGEKMLEWEPCPSRGWAPRRPVEQPRRTGKKGCDSQKSWGGGQCVSVFVQSPTHLSHTTLSIKGDVYFSQELYLLVFTVLNMFLHAYVYV